MIEKTPGFRPNGDAHKLPMQSVAKPLPDNASEHLSNVVKACSLLGQLSKGKMEVPGGEPIYFYCIPVRLADEFQRLFEKLAHDEGQAITREIYQKPEGN